ncbi:MAG: aminomethyl-transferring glycine dehydrogenase [Euryarchaeota archaeon]|nr:aminomethyl-transferring glycine dehydrogenase [Euryarchaeota archaeon]
MTDHLPNLGRENEMLAAMGHSSMDDLFVELPDNVRCKEPLALPEAQSEEEILADARRLLGSNIDLGSTINFLGSGLYRNFVPSSVFQLITRGEFLTSYTPYQPEVSQGMLQAMWEFQSLITELVGLPIANLSVYDGSTAAAEAITCAVRVHARKAEQKNTVYISELIPPDRLSVIQNYTQGSELIIKSMKHDDNGHIPLEEWKKASGSCAVYVEQPNPLGIMDQSLFSAKEILGNHTAFIVGIQPVSLGVFEPPGNYGADIVVGEGQPLGSPVTYGGPIYGIFACTQPYLRQMPGRIVGRTIDVDGKEAYCLTLSTREQHIRRHRATSNLCTNETLIAMMGAMHMALLGPEGIETLGLRNLASRQLLQEGISKISDVELPYADSQHFNEFVIELPYPAQECLDYLEKFGIIGGLNLSRWYPGWDHRLLISTSDQTSKSDIKILLNRLSKWLTSKSGVVA